MAAAHDVMGSLPTDSPWITTRHGYSSRPAPMRVTDP